MFGTNFIPKPSDAINGGVQSMIDFGEYQLSIVQHDHSYGGTQGLWEIGIFQGNDMVELPPITKDGDTVKGFLSEDDVANIIVELTEMTGNEPKEIAK